MATDSNVVAIEESDARRKQAILRAVGLDRAAPEQRELAIAIAKRYDLDLMLKHLVLIDGKPYVTRDALLWIAHRDGHLDGIEVTEPVVRDYQGVDYWYCEATVYRSDMTHPFKYGGRYPVKGGNAKFGPEMATKVAESMSLRRAFNISAPTQDERFDVEQPVYHPDEQTADHPLPDPVQTAPQAEEPTEAEFRPVVGAEVPADDQHEPVAIPKAGLVQCPSISPLSQDQCLREEGHPTNRHRTRSESWTS